MKRAVPVAVVTALLISLLVSAQPITGGGGLTKVTHGSAMTGSGTSAAPLDLRHDCGSGQTVIWGGSAWGCGSAGGGVTNGAAANVIPKSDGTNLVTSLLTDNATTLSYNGGKFAVTASSGNTVDQGTLTVWGALAGSGNVSLGDASADAIAFNGSASTALNMNTHQIFGVVDPTLAQDVATKHYVDGTPTTITTTGTIVDLSIGAATVVYMNPASSANLYGIAGGVDGRQLQLCNISGAAYPTVIGDDATETVAANRISFDLQDAAGYWSLVKNQCLRLSYSSTAARWIADRASGMPWLNVAGSATIGTGLTVAAGGAAVTGNSVITGTAQVSSDLSSNGAIINGGTAPTLSTCGTSPTATKGPQNFTITVGSGTATTCTATFANAPLAAVPTCQVQSQSSTIQTVYLSAISASAMTISNVGGANMAGIKLDVICVGH